MKNKFLLQALIFMLVVEVIRKWMFPMIAGALLLAIGVITITGIFTQQKKSPKKMKIAQVVLGFIMIVMAFDLLGWYGVIRPWVLA